MKTSAILAAFVSITPPSPMSASPAESQATSALDVRCPLEICPLSPEGISQLQSYCTTLFARVGWDPANWTLLVDWENREAFRLGLWLAPRSLEAFAKDDPQTRHTTCEACTEFQVVEASVELVARLTEHEQKRREAAARPAASPPRLTVPTQPPPPRIPKMSAVAIGIFFGGFAATGITTVVVADLQRRQAPGLPPSKQDHFATYLGTALSSAAFLVAAVTLTGVELAALRKAKRARPDARVRPHVGGLEVVF